MTASARDVRLLQTARRILEEAGRPLNVRRILRAGEQDGRFEGEPTLEELRAALVSEAAEGVVSEARPGIFVLAEAGAGEREAPEAAAKAPGRPARAATREVEAAPDVEEDDKRRRRRRRRDSRAEGPSETPISLDEAAELSESAPDRDSLKGKLWERLRRKAAQVTDQPAPDGAPRVEAEKARASAPSPKETEEGARRRRRRRDGGERSEAAPTPTADEKPRRRRRRSESGDDAPEQAVAPVAAAAGQASSADDPRARLKARLAGRGRPSDAAEPTSPAPAAAPKAPAAAPAADAASDPRALLKNRLAARLTDEEPPAREATRRRRRRGGEAEAPARPAESAGEASDPKAALRARLASRVARAPEARAPAAAAKPAPVASAPKPAPARAASAAEASPSDPRARLKARLAARQDDSSPTATPARATPAPAAPALAEKPAAAPPARREVARDPRSALKARLAARAGVEAPPAPAAAPVASTVSEAAPAASPAASGGDARSALKARLAARRGAETSARPVVAEPAAPVARPAAPAQSAPARASAQDPRSALKARLAARQGADRAASEPVAAPKPAADPLEVPLADSRRPYREKRSEHVEPSTERRAPALAEVSPTSTLVSAALAALRGHGSPMALDALAKEVDATAEGGAGGLRAALLAENGRRDRVGLRPPFVAHYGGAVGLTEWGLSARYRALENQIQEALAEQRELVRRDLLARIGDLTDLGFEQVVVMLLEQLGHHRVGVVHRQAGTVALTVTRTTDGGGTEKIAVVARRSWGPIKDGTVRRIRDTLAHFEADSGLIITVGTFAGSARAEARQEGQAHVRLIDGAGLAGLLFDHGIGLAHHQPMMRYLDAAFFESLEA